MHGSDPNVVEIVVTVSEKIKAGTGSIVVVDKDGKIVTSDFTGAETIKDNTLTIAYSTPKTITGKYTFNFPTGYVKDLSLAANASDAASIVYDFGAGTPAAAAELKATVTPAGTNKFNVAFSDTVTTASAESASNYSLNGTALPADTKVVLASDLKNVTITLPAGSIATSNNAAYLVVSGVVSYKGTTVTTTTQNVQVVDNVAPTLVSATKTSNGIVLKFSEKLNTTTVEVADFTYDGKALAEGASVTATDDTVTITGVTLEAGKKIAVAKDAVTDLVGNNGAAGEVVIQ